MLAGDAGTATAGGGSFFLSGLGFFFLLFVFLFAAAIIVWALVASFLSEDSRMTPRERGLILKVICWRRKAGVPRPRIPPDSRLVVAVAGIMIAGLLFLAATEIGLSPMWFLFLPTVAVFAILPLAGLLEGSDRRPSPRSRGLVRGRVVEPWSEINYGKDLQVVRRCTSSLDSGWVTPPPRSHRGRGAIRKVPARSFSLRSRA